MNKIKYFVFFILIFLVKSLSGQQYYTKNFNINDGLPDNCISVIFKDSHNYLWLGTQAGLSQFNGREFKTYTSLDGLSGNNIKSIVEDQEGNIWIGCYKGGISKFDGEKFSNLSKNEGLINTNITKIQYIKESQILLIGTDDGLSVYDGKGITSYHNSLHNVDERLDITGFLETSNSIFILTRTSGLYEFIPETRLLQKVNSKNPLNNSYLFAAAITENDDTLISYGRNGFKIRNKNERIYNNLGNINCFAADKKNNIWIGASDFGNNEGGIYRLENQIVTNFNSQFGIESKNVLSLFLDETDNILWIGTEDNGLYLFPGDIFSYYTGTDFNLKDIKIKDIALDKENNLWILTNNALIKKLPNGKFKLIKLEVLKNQFITFKKNELESKYHYLIDTNGSFENYQELIIKKLYNYNNPYLIIKDGKPEILKQGSLFMPNRYDIILQKDITEFIGLQSDQTNNIWLGTNTGIFRINSETLNSRYFDLDGNFFTSFTILQNKNLIVTDWDDVHIYNDIEKSSLYSLYSHIQANSPVNVSKTKLKNNQVWFLSSDHFLFLFENNTFYSFNNPDSSEYQQLNDICFDSKGNIIVGGKEGVVFIMELIENKLNVKYRISKLNGLSGTNIRWLNCTKKDQLYIGTNTGINIIDLNDLYTTDQFSIKKFNKSAGYIDYSGFKSELDNNNILWIGANGKLLSIESSKIDFNGSHNLIISLLSIEVNDKIIPKRDWKGSEKNPIVLPWSNNSIAFNLNAIKFIDPENIFFNYTLDNGKKITSKRSKEFQVDFQNLNPGSYKFGVTSLSDSYQDQANELTVLFEIQKPFWKNWWIISISLASLFTIILFSMHFRTQLIKKQERKRLEINEKITQLELNALRAQMNPHFIFNAINSIQNYMLGNDVDSALNYLSDFAKLIRITLDNVSKKFVTLEEELNYLKYYLSLEQMRFDNKFDTVINVPNDFDYNRILIPPMIIQPYIEDAIKNGLANNIEKSLIKIDFFIETQGLESSLHCIIEDTGVGQKTSTDLTKNNKEKLKSKGTLITSERLALLNQTQLRKGYNIKTNELLDSGKMTIGSRVDITFPI